jgi:cell division protein FtsQ
VGTTAKNPKNSEAVQDSASYLRREKPLRVRRGLGDLRHLPLRRLAVLLLVAGLSGSTAYSVDRFLRTDPTFQFPSDGSGLLVSGLSAIDTGEVRRFFQPDFGKNLLDVPLDERQQQIASLPWAERVAVARVWSNQVWVHVEERTPVAFVRLERRGKDTMLVDANGVFLEPPDSLRLTLPVLSGIDTRTPVDERVRRIRLYLNLMNELDSAAPRYGSMVSEVQVADPRNAKVTAVYHGEAIELQIGEEYFRHRFELFLKYYPSWQREYGAVRSVDLRFKGQVALE